MGNICHETALRLYEILKGEAPETDPAETVALMENAIQDVMFQAGYCERRCDSKDCEQADGGNGT